LRQKPIKEVYEIFQNLQKNKEVKAKEYNYSRNKGIVTDYLIT